MVVSLIGPIESPYVQRTLLVAAYAGIQLKLVPIELGNQNETEEYRLNCHPMQRVPVMKTDEGYLFESNAMIRYLARTEVMLVAVNAGIDGASNEKIPHPQFPVPYAMYGHSLVESTQVDSWLDFAITHIDRYTRQFAAFERKPGAPKPDADAKTLLWKSMAGLERRLAYLREARRTLLQQSGSLTARSAITDEELLWNEEDYMATRATRDSRLSAVYNVAGSIRQRATEKDRQERERQIEAIRRSTNEALGEEDSADDAHRPSRRMSSARDSSMITATPRASMFMSARGSHLGGAGGAGAPIQRQDLIFLVGDSLTAADLVMAMALHFALTCQALKAELVAQFPGAFKYYKNILALPVATEVGKAMRLNVVRA